MPITIGHAQLMPLQMPDVKGMLHLHRWIDLSESAKDLVLGMLDTDPKKRLTAKQVSIPSQFGPYDIYAHKCAHNLSLRMPLLDSCLRTLMYTLGIAVSLALNTYKGEYLWEQLHGFMLTCGFSHGMQVLAHSWVTTRGGLVPKLLNPNVARGAANVASVRRLRNLVHGAIALKSLRALKVGLRPASSAAIIAVMGIEPTFHMYPNMMTKHCPACWQRHIWEELCSARSPPQHWRPLQQSLRV